MNKASRLRLFLLHVDHLVVQLTCMSHSSFKRPPTASTVVSPSIEQLLAPPTARRNSQCLERRSSSSCCCSFAPGPQPSCFHCFFQRWIVRWEGLRSGSGGGGETVRVHKEPTCEVLEDVLKLLTSSVLPMVQLSWPWPLCQGKKFYGPAGCSVCPPPPPLDASHLVG